MKRTLYEYWQIAGALTSGGLGPHTFLWIHLLSVPLRKKLYGRKPIKLTFFFNGTSFVFLIRDGADIAVLREIFVDREYALRTGPAPRTIVDIGGHIGCAAAFFACTYPNASITVYEADPDNVALLKENMRQFPQVTSVGAAVAGAPGEVTLFRHAQSSISSSLKSRGEKGVGIQVPAVSLDDVLRTAVDLLKFDIEGAEYDLFAASTRVPQCPLYIGEVHYDLMNKSREDFVSLFPGYSHEERPVGNQRSIMTLRRNAP